MLGLKDTRSILYAANLISFEKEIKTYDRGKNVKREIHTR